MKTSAFARALVPLVACAVLLSTRVQADPLDQWTLRNPLPTGNKLSGIAYGLADWLTITNVALTTSSAQFTDPAAPSFSRRFCRALVP